MIYQCMLRNCWITCLTFNFFAGGYGQCKNPGFDGWRTLITLITSEMIYNNLPMQVETLLDIYFFVGGYGKCKNLGLDGWRTLRLLFSLDWSVVIRSKQCLVNI